MIVDSIAFGDLHRGNVRPVNPAKLPDEAFDLYSLPAYEGRVPESVLGSQIGSSKAILEPGDTVLCKIVPHIRRAWVIPEAGSNRQLGSGEWIVLRHKQVDPNYRRHLLLADTFHSQFMNTVAGVGGSLMRARPAQASAIRIPLPPLPEQRRIATILHQADNLRVKRRQALALLNVQGLAIFHEMFDPSSKSKTAGLLTLSDARSGGTPSKKRKDHWVGPIPWFSPKDPKAPNLWDSIDHVSAAALSETSISILPANTVATVVRGMILAHSFPIACLRVEGTINQDMKALIPRQIMNPQFLAHAMRAQTPIALAALSNAGHGTKRLDSSGLGSIQIPMVSIEVQDEFGRQISSIEVLQDSNVSHLRKLDELFASLQYCAFRGEL